VDVVYVWYSTPGVFVGIKMHEIYGRVEVPADPTGV
jgi:hypothetical protein